MPDAEPTDRLPPFQIGKDTGTYASAGFQFQDVVTLATLIQSHLGIRDYDALFPEVGNDIVARVKTNGELMFDVVQVTAEMPPSGKFKPNSPKLVSAVLGFAKNEREAGRHVRAYVFQACYEPHIKDTESAFREQLVQAAREESDAELAPHLSAVVKKLSFPQPLPVANAEDILISQFICRIREAEQLTMAELKSATAAALGHLQAIRSTLRKDVRATLNDLLSPEAHASLAAKKAVSTADLLKILNIPAARSEHERTVGRVNSYLDSVELRCRHTCGTSLSLLGVDPAAASRFADTLGAEVCSDLLARTDRRLVMIHGPLGSGKTYAALQVAMRFVRDRRASDQAPVPVFVTSEDMKDGRSVEDAIRIALGDAGATPANAALIVDGADELGVELMRQLVAQCISAVGRVPGLTCTVTCRTNVDYGAGIHCVQLPMAQQFDAAKIMSIASNGQCRDQTIELAIAHLGAAANVPLIAWLAGVALGTEVPISVHTRTTLIRSIAQRALIRQPAARSGTIHARLCKLASMLIERPGQAIARAEFDTPTAVQQLVQTGLVEHHQDVLKFAIPFLCEWFAAEAMVADPVHLLRATEGGAITDRWQEALVFAAEMLTDAALDDALARLTGKDPGALFKLLQAIDHATFRSSPPALPDDETAGRRLYKAADAVVTGCRSTSRWLGNIVDDAGRARRVGVLRRGSQYVVEWSDDSTSGPMSFVLTPEQLKPSIRAGRLDTSFDVEGLGGRWSEIRAGLQRLMDPHASALWPWFWVRKDASEFLDEYIKRRFFVVGEGPLILETCWQTAKEVAGTGASSIFDPVLSVAGLQDAVEILLTKIPEGEARRMKPYGDPIHNWQLKALKTLLSRLRERGATAWQGPLPAADEPQLGRGASPVWSDYSLEQMKRRLNVVYRDAQQAYMQLVDQWFPELAPRMRHRVHFPVKLRARVELPPDYRTNGHGGALGWTYFYDPLPTSSAPEAEFFMLYSTDRVAWPKENWTDADLNESHRKLTEYRRFVPKDVAFMAGVGMLPASPFHADPIHRLVYSWLASDLYDLGLKITLIGA